MSKHAQKQARKQNSREACQQRANRRRISAKRPSDRNQQTGGPGHIRPSNQVGTRAGKLTDRQLAREAVGQICDTCAGATTRSTTTTVCRLAGVTDLRHLLCYHHFCVWVCAEHQVSHSCDTYTFTSLTHKTYRCHACVTSVRV